MNRRHALVISVFLAVALVAGMVAALRTTQLGAAAKPRISATQIAAKNQQLDGIEAKLQAAALKRPPALSASQRRPAGQPARVIYVRPKPVVHVVHRQGEHETDHGEGGGSGD